MQFVQTLDNKCVINFVHRNYT